MIGCHLETLFLVGGYSSGFEEDGVKTSIHSASLTALIDRALHHSNGSTSAESLWTALEDVPYCDTAAASIGGCLLALGGTDNPQWVSMVSDSICTYLPTSSTWTQVGELPYLFIEPLPFYCRLTNSSSLGDTTRNIDSPNMFSRELVLFECSL